MKVVFELGNWFENVTNILLIIIIIIIMYVYSPPNLIYWIGTA